MTTILSSLFFFILALGILITVHEFGHFWVARKLGVKVLRFSVGFGKPIWSKRGKVDDTEFVVAAIPFGGYISMLDEREGDVAPDEAHRAFNRQPVWVRSAVVLAGPVFNFILSIAAYWLVFVIGVTSLKPIVGVVAEGSIAEKAGLQQGEQIVAVAGREIATWESAVVGMLENAVNDGEIVLTLQQPDSSAVVEKRFDFSSIPDDLNRGGLLDYIGVRPYRPLIPALIGKLSPGGAAEKAGIEIGDVIISVDGQTIDDWEEWVDYVRSRPEQRMVVVVDREGAHITLELTPARIESATGDIGKIGAGVELPELPEELTAVEKFGPLDAVVRASVKTWDMSVLTLKMLGKMVVGDVSLSNLSGPISIAQYAGYSASAGFISFLTFLAIVSISLGVLNLLPIPMLDGGHLFYYIVEAIKGSPVSENGQLIGQKIGIIVLVGAMSLAFYNDILRLFMN